MKIFIISRGLPTSRDPQWGNFETDQAKALAKLGHNITMLSIDVRFSNKKNKIGITKVKEDDFISYSLNPGPWVISKFLNKNLYYWIFSKFLLKLFEKTTKSEGLPDLIYAHYQDLSFASLVIKRTYNIPIVGLEHWSALGLENLPKIALEHGQLVYRSLDKVLAVSEYLRDKIKENFDIEPDVVNNIIGDQFCYKEYVNTTGIVHFALTGNLIPLKGFDIVIKALRIVIQLHNNIKVTIVGDGPEKSNLKNLIEKYELKEYIEMVGRKDREYIVNLLQHSDVFILSSFSETFGVAAGEALACGVPVISTNCGGSRDFMNEFNGLQIPINDINAMANAISYMVEHHLDFNRKRIAIDCNNKFSSENIANRLDLIFKSILKK